MRFQPGRLFSREEFFLLATLVFSWKSDGTFPLPKGLPAGIYALQNGAVALALAGLAALAARAESRALKNKRFVIFLALLFGASMAVNCLNSWKYAASGYRFSAPGTLALGLLFALVPMALWTRRAVALILALAAARAGFDLYALWNFPLAQERSDMLIAIQQASLRWWNEGISPYQPIASSGADLRMPYFPLNWLVYLPLALRGWDL